MWHSRVGLSDSANPGLSDSIPSGLQGGYWQHFEEQAISIPLKTAKNLEDSFLPGCSGLPHLCQLQEWQDPLFQLGGGQFQDLFKGDGVLDIEFAGDDAGSHTAHCFNFSWASALTIQISNLRYRRMVSCRRRNCKRPRNGPASPSRHVCASH